MSARKCEKITYRCNFPTIEEVGLDDTIDQDELVDLVVGGVGGATADVWVEGGDKKSHLALDTNHKKVK